MTMVWTAFLKVSAILFHLLSWPSFALILPVYASSQAIESNSCSKSQQCLTFWVLFALFNVLEQALSRLFLGFPFWPYLKGVATVLLVIPYCGGASYVYKHLVMPYSSKNLQIWNILIIPTRTCFGEIWDIVASFIYDQFLIEGADTGVIENEQETLEEFLFPQVPVIPNNYQARTENTLPTSKQIVQREWSCAFCLVSTSSEQCLKEHLNGKTHKEREQHLRGEEVSTRIPCNSSFVLQKNNGMVLLGNVVKREGWTGLLNPISRSIIRCRWRKLGYGWMKLNTDGSIDRENAGLGGLLRDYEGNAICGFVSKAPRDDIFFVEILAIWRGLVLALGLGITALWVESDSLSVVRTINKKQPYSGKAEKCLKRIWELLKKFKRYKVSHSWRETNRAADYLSKMVLERSDVVLWPADFPSALCKIINDDAQGKIYLRR